MAIIDFFLDHQFERGPAPLRWIRTRYIDHYFEQHVMQRTFAADQAHAGLVTMCWSAETPTATILAWFDDHLAATPRIGPMDQFRMFVVCATAEEVRESIACRIPLPHDRLLSEWTGHRQEWWAEGRDRIAHAIATTDADLYTVLNGLGRSFTA